MTPYNPSSLSSRDYSPVTEVPGDRVSREAIDMVYTRYEFAARRSAGKRVLEIGCGSGVGLRHLSRCSGSVVGGDYTWSLLCSAKGHRPSVPLVQFDAHALPFQSSIFDLVVLFETLYFLENPALVMDTCRRVLREGGTLLIITANPEISAFNPAPYSTRYWTAAELRVLMQQRGFDVTLFCGFRTRDDGLRAKFFTTIKKLAVRFDLIPRTMKGKEAVKRIVFGPLEAFPSELAASPGAYREPVRVEKVNDLNTYKVIYAEGKKNART